MKISGCVDVGKIRSENEDNIYINGQYIKDGQNRFLMSGEPSGKVNVIAVFDGMGGEANGRLAARIAAEELCRYQDVFTCDNASKWDSIVQCFISSANNRIEKVVAETRQNMGATMALMLISGDMAKTYNMGDSRIYLYSGGVLRRLSRDHTIAAQLLESGIITESESRSHVKRNQLTRHLGLPESECDVTPHAAESSVRAGEVYILCSDGLTDMCDDHEIESIIKLQNHNTNIAEELTELALRNGGRDNISVIAVQS